MPIHKVEIEISIFPMKNSGARTHIEYVCSMWFQFWIRSLWFFFDFLKFHHHFKNSHREWGREREQNYAYKNQGHSQCDVKIAILNLPHFVHSLCFVCTYHVFSQVNSMWILLHALMHTLWHFLAIRSLIRVRSYSHPHSCVSASITVDLCSILMWTNLSLIKLVNL